MSVGTALLLRREKSQCAHPAPLLLLRSSWTAVRAHYTPSGRLIPSGRGGDGAEKGDSAGAGQGRGRPGQARPGHVFLVLFLFFSYDKLS